MSILRFYRNLLFEGWVRYIKLLRNPVPGLSSRNPVPRNPVPGLSLRNPVPGLSL